MSNLEIHTIRLRVDTNSTGGLTDTETGAMPAIWRGNDVELQVGLFKGKAPSDANPGTPLDISRIASLTLELFDRKGGSLVSSVTLSAEDLDTTLDAATWKDGSKAHATLLLTHGQTNIAPATGSDRKEAYLALHCVTDHTPGRRLTLGAGSIAVLEDYVGAPVTPPDPTPDYYTAAESDARFLQKLDGLPAGDAWRITPDGLEMYNATTATWHRLFLGGNPTQLKLTAALP
jgi:hypothetical protein